MLDESLRDKIVSVFIIWHNFDFSWYFIPGYLLLGMDLEASNNERAV